MFVNDFAPIVKSYIDPGTGSMLFTVLLGLISAATYGVRGFVIKVKSLSNKDDVKNYNSIPFLIYTDSKRYWNTFKPICDEFEKRKINVSYYTQSFDDPALDENYNYVDVLFIGEGNKGIGKMNFVSADIVLSTTPSLDVYQWKRSKNAKYYIHIPHACADLTMYRMFGIDYFDAVLLTSSIFTKQVRKLEELRKLPSKDIEVVGLTYFDEMKKRLDGIGNISNKNPVVLLAPTWGGSSLLNVYGDKIIDRLIETGYEIVVRPHPQSYVSEKGLIKKLKEKYPEIGWNEDNDNFDILNKADILISDFSGVMFDFSLIFDKPVLYSKYKFDNSIYDAWWLDEELWTHKVLPLLGEEINENNIDNIKGIIDQCINDGKYQNGRNEARRQAWENVGNSANAIVDFMIKKQKGT